ncbi:MAG TPA: LPS export ABC transporter permease LptF [Steroidobacteraceae bacterium]|nr:LPS export ABC transporter permease LptF [Steroidobacteraceae bacterium]
MRASARGIFFRHVLREVAAQTLIVAAVLLAVLVIYQLSFVLGRAADGQIPGAAVMQLAALSLRSNLGVILPFAVLLGVVLGLGCLYHDSEIAAAHAGGIGRTVLYSAVSAVVLPATVLAAWVAFVDGPAAAREAVTLRLEALRTAVTRGFAPGGFRALGDSATLHFVTREADGALSGVFVQRELPATAAGPARQQVVLAARARYHMPDSDVIEVELLDGESYEGRPGERGWRLTRFERQLIQLPAPDARLPGRPRVDALGNGELLASADPLLVSELHWRLGWVVAVLVLGLLAVPLARLSPRQGRHARIPLAITLFAVHAGLLTSGRTLLERAETPLALGLWWVHAAVILLALAVLAAPGLYARVATRRVR